MQVGLQSGWVPVRRLLCWPVGAWWQWRWCAFIGVMFGHCVDAKGSLVDLQIILQVMGAMGLARINKLTRGTTLMIEVTPVEVKCDQGD